MKSYLDEMRTANMLMQQHQRADSEDNKAWTHGDMEFFVAPTDFFTKYIIKYEDGSVFAYDIKPVDDSGIGVNIEISIIENYSDEWFKF